MLVESGASASGLMATGESRGVTFCAGMEYCSRGRLVSTAGGVALKFILAAFLNTGLNDDVISMVFLLVSWAYPYENPNSAISSKI
jgi:hypothetical protein